MRYFFCSLMPNIRKLQESKRCGKRCDNQSNAIIDAVARKMNKENTSYYSKRVSRGHQNIVNMIL